MTFKSVATISSSPSQNIFVYFATCTYRILNALLIQSQFDPDEYWQTLEPAYCEAFGDDRPCAYTWEWTRRHLDFSSSTSSSSSWWRDSIQGPVRSYLSVFPTFLFYVLVKRFRWDTPWMISKGPMIFHAVLVAAPTDMAVWYMAQFIPIRTNNSKEEKGNVLSTNNSPNIVAFWCLACSIMSWFNGYALIRTYSNSAETVLLAVGMALLSPELLGNHESHSERQVCVEVRQKYYLRAALAFILGGMSVSIRFTSLAAWIPIGIILALSESYWWKTCQFMLFPCALCGMVGVGLGLLCDWWFYGFWTVPFLGNIHFNVLLGYGSLYGTHPIHWYVSSGIPVIGGMFLPFLLYDLWNVIGGIYRKEQPTLVWRRNLWLIVASYTALHSFSAHKEFRFLLPILPPLCLLTGYTMSTLVGMSDASNEHQEEKRKTTTKKSQLLLMALFLLNIPHLLYLGMLHQRSPIDVNQCIVNTIQEEQQACKRSSHFVPKKYYSIHYLMGCHSTPLYSHLHTNSNPDVRVDAWTLDCSPSCRVSETCESHNFSKDPVGFVEERYEQFLIEQQRDLCLADICHPQDIDHETTRRTSPDFLAVFAGDAFWLQTHLVKMGFLKQEIGRFFHGVNGVRIGSMVLGNDFEEEAYRHISGLFGWFEFSLDEMLLFTRGA